MKDRSQVCEPGDHDAQVSSTHIVANLFVEGLGDVFALLDIEKLH